MNKLHPEGLAEDRHLVIQPEGVIDKLLVGRLGIEAVSSELALTADETREEGILYLPHHPHDHVGFALLGFYIDFVTMLGEDAPSIQASSSEMSPSPSSLLSSL